MYNFLKLIFGIPPGDQGESGMIDNGDNDLRSEVWGGDNKSEEDDIFGSNFGGINNFGVNAFSDPIKFHKEVSNFIMGMQKQFGMFSFGNFHSGVLTEDDFFSPPFSEETTKSGNMRDMYLKSPGYNNDPNIKKDINLDGQINVDDVENLLNSKPGPSDESSSLKQYSPKIYSKVVVINKKRLPDGSVKTVKKIQDNTGHVETIITEENIRDPPKEPDLAPMDDITGGNFIKKFFNF